MPLDSKITIAGLYTNGNQNTAIPAGALSAATNVVVRANGQLEPRRGMAVETATVSSGSISLNTLAFYGGGRVVQYTDNAAASKLAYSTAAGASWNAYTGTYVPVDSATQRMKFVEANQNLYFNTSAGLKFLTSLTGTPTLAGVIAPFDIGGSHLLTGNPNATGTWFTTNTAVAYRAVFGIRDANNNLKLSAPTGRRVVINPADFTVTTRTRAANVVTATTSAAHGLVTGQIVNFATADVGPPAFALGNFTVTGTPTSTTFTYAEVGANGTVVATRTGTSGTKNVAVTLWFDSDYLTTSHFVRLYRTVMSTSATADPGDEMFQVYERKITTTDLAGGGVSLTDITPESSLYSSPLYTNPKTGDSIVAAADMAPISEDLALWKERLWFANTTGKQRYTLQIIGVGTPDGIQHGDALTIGEHVFAFSSGAAITTAENVLFTETNSASENIRRVAVALVEKINSLAHLGTITYKASYISAVGDAPGRILLERVDPDGGVFYIAAGRSTSFVPTLTLASNVTNIARVGTTVTVTTAVNHGFDNGQNVYLESYSAAIAAFPLGTKSIFVSSPTVFTYTESGAVAAQAGTSYYAQLTDNTSASDVRPNGIMFSKYQEPEAIPLANYFTVGAKNKDILRIVPLREKLYVFKEDGVYTVSGEPPYQSVQLLDASCILLAPDSAVVLGGQIYALTSQGVCTISDSGVQVISYPIERDLRSLVQAAIDPLSVDPIGEWFGAAYESDRLYVLGFYNLSVGGHTQYVYSYMTKAWTKWSVTSNMMGVDPATDKLVSAGTAELHVESKTYTYADYADSVTAVTISNLNTTAKTFTALTGSISVGALISRDGGWGVVTNAVSGGPTSTFTYVSGTTGLATNGSATVYTGYAVTVTFARNTSAQPAIAKHFKEAYLHFGKSTAYKYTLTFVGDDSTDTFTLASPLANTASWTHTAPQYRNTRALVPDEIRRATSLLFGFTITEGGAFFQLDGHSLDVAPISTKVGR